MTSLSKEEYLKRYLSAGGDDSKEKKKKKKDKKKKAVLAPVRMRIIDNDADVPSAAIESVKEKSRGQSLEDEEDEEPNIEEMPTIAAVEDERPHEVKVLEEFKKSGRWRTFTGEDLTAKHIVQEVIKLEVKEELDDDYGEFPPPKRKKKHHKKAQADYIKQEPLSPNQEIKEEVEERRRYDSDESPPRQRKRHDSDASPPRQKQRHDSDASPPRQRQRHDSDASPPRQRQRHDSDASPPRQRQRHDSDASPPRQRQRHDSDASPPRQRQRHDSDVSPPRQRKRHDLAASPPRKCAPKDSDGDLSPPRKSRKEHSDSDLSPPRNGSGTRKGARGGSDSDMSPPRQRSAGKLGTTLDGKRAGLQKAGDLKEELAAIRERERKNMESMDAELSGRFARTQVRGRLKEEEERKRKEKEKKEVPEEVKAKFNQWNKGVKQVEAAHARLEDNLYEMSKPLTRTEDDVDREALLKDQEREEDPMLAYMRKKKEKVVGKVKKFPAYQGPQPPPNRFGIRPGYRWDGVVRTNGFEQRLMTRGSEKRATELEAYKWSIEEM